MKSYQMHQGVTCRATICAPVLMLIITVLSSTTGVAQKKAFAVNSQTNPLKEYNIPSNRESHPFFVDIDKDGDLDCFSGEYTNGQVSKIYYYRNDGNNKHPLFKAVSGQANPLDKVTANRLSIPYFIDIDGDGDYDCFIGEGTTGALMYYKNNGTATSPDFQKQSAAFNPLSMVKFSTSDIANPAFADVDGDGDYDCLIVDEAGLLNYFRNNGTAAQPAFVHVENDDNPFRSLQVKGGIYNVSFEDWNKDGLIDLFVNSNYYKNTGTQRRPQFSADNNDNPVLQTASSYQFTYTPLRWVDLNNDGTKEVVQGNDNGGFTYQTLSADKNVPAVPVIAMQVAPNPTKSDFILNMQGNTPSVLRVIDVQGKVLSTQITSSSIVKFGTALKPGIYMLQVMQNNKVVYSQKLVKE